MGTILFWGLYMRFALHYSILFALMVTTMFPAFSMAPHAKVDPTVAVASIPQPTASDGSSVVAISLDEGEAKVQGQDYDTKRGDGFAKSGTKNAPKDQIVHNHFYKLQLKNQAMLFSEHLLKQAEYFDVHTAFNKQAKQDETLIILPEDLPISLEALHAVLSIIADPLQRPMKEKMSEYLKDKDVMSFCYAADALRIKYLLNITVMLLAEKLIKTNFDATLIAALKQLPLEIQYLISSKVIYLHPSTNDLISLFWKPIYREAFDFLYNYKLAWDRSDQKIMSVSGMPGQAVLGDNSQVSFFDVNTKAITKFERPLSLISNALFSNNAQYIAFCGADIAPYGVDSDIAVLDSKNDKKLVKKILCKSCKGLVWVKDDTKIKIVCEDNVIRSWEIDGDNNDEKKLTNEKSEVSKAQWSHNGKLIAICYKNDFIHIVDSDTGESRTILQIPAGFRLPDIKWSYDDNYLAIYFFQNRVHGSDNSLFIFDVNNRLYIQRFRSNDDISRAMTWLHDGSIALAVDKQVYIYDVIDGTLLAKYHGGDHGAHSLTGANHSNKIASCYYPWHEKKAWLYLWDLQDNKLPTLSIDELVELFSANVNFEEIKKETEAGKQLTLYTLPPNFEKLPYKIQEVLLPAYSNYFWTMHEMNKRRGLNFIKINKNDVVKKLIKDAKSKKNRTPFKSIASFALTPKVSSSPPVLASSPSTTSSNYHSSWLGRGAAALGLCALGYVGYRYFNN